jgi:uncharacterized protein (TIGR00369 family)
VLAKEKRRQITEKLESYPFYSHLKMNWLWFDALNETEGQACIAMPFFPALANLDAGLHGGATASLIDTANNLALLTVSEEGDHLTLIQLNINYLAPADKGTVVVLARDVRIGHRVVYGHAEVFNTNDEPLRPRNELEYEALKNKLQESPPIAISQGTYWVRKRPS